MIIYMNNIQKYGTFFDSKLEKTQLYGLFIVYGIYEYVIEKSHKLKEYDLMEYSLKEYDLMEYSLKEYDVD
jgi:hypothetical protein